MSMKKQKMDPSEVDPKVEWWFGIIAIAVLFFLFRFLDKYSVKNKMKIKAREQLLLSEAGSNPFAKTETNHFGNQ